MSLQVLVNGFDVANGVTHRINWVETTGLFDPAALVDPEAVDTFEGPFRVRQTTVDYGMREVSISGILLVAASDYASKLRALDGLQAIYAPRPSRVMVGTLELSVDFGRVEVENDQLKRLNGMIKYTVRGTAIPATFACTYGAGTGLVQGIPVDTQRINEPATLATMASGVGTITCLGNVPTPAVLTIQGAANTIYYLATSATGRRVPISTNSLGVGRIDERAGLYLAPGTNRITAYQAATGTATLTTITVMSFFGTTWRYSGNAVAGNATRFDLGPALTHARMGTATYWNGSTLLTAGDNEPRIGFVASGTGNGGLVVEGEATNRCLQSQDLSVTANWTQTATATVSYNQTAPDATATAFRATSSGTATVTQTITGLSSGTTYTFSVWLRSPSSSYDVDIAITDTATTSTTCTLTTTWTRFSVTRTVGATSATITIGANSSWTVFEIVEVWGAQFEQGMAPSSYIPTTTATVIRRADVVGMVAPHNYIQYSEPISQGTIGAATSPWKIDPWTAATSTVDSPQGVDNATLVNVATSGTPGLYQDIVIPGGVAGKIYTFSCWIRQNATTTSVVLRILEQTGLTARGTFTCNIDSTWRRFFVTARMDASDTGIRVRISEYNTAGSIVVFGAQLNEGAVPARYVRTTDQQILPSATILDGAWSQNGYIEADFRWRYNTGFSTTAHYMLGDTVTSNSGAIRLDVGGGGANIVRFLRYYADAVSVASQFTDSAFAQGESGRLRLEWTNYTLGGVRYMFIRTYTVAGGVATLKNELNVASTVGSTWPVLDITRLARIGAQSGHWQGVVSNIVFGTPQLPEGATPAGI